VSAVRITDVVVTPVAFRDPPLLNAVGVHEQWAIRTIIEVHTDAGVVGLGETYGDLAHLERVRRLGMALLGADVFGLHRAFALASGTVRGEQGSDRHGLTGQFTDNGTIDRLYSPFDVALLDIQGKLLGVSVADLLGGRVRDAVPFSAYLFYKWAAHPGQEPDSWGEALDPDGIVEQARRMVAEFGFTAIKLKGGVFHPDQEVEAIRALSDALPGVPLRLDPNAAWTVETSVRVARELEGVLEYLEDPTPGIEGMAAVRRQVDVPLATNMCVVAFDHLEPAVKQGAVDIILSDHHYWGGLRRSANLAGFCDAFGIGLSMHSNSHLGISLAAMVHLAGSTPNLTYACDTHWPWKDEDLIVGDPLPFADGGVAVPTGPGLGVELDRDALARMHEQYLAAGIVNRDDTTYMQSIDPTYRFVQPRW